MNIYRVEHKKHKDGPYIGKHWTGLGQVHNNDEHPAPKNDIGRPIKPSERCGFRTKSDYKKWFNSDERKLLLDYGFHLVKYKVPKKFVTLGKQQLVFKNSKGIRVKAFDCCKTHLTKKIYLDII